ncbi:MAG: DUF6531 domain-containing protein, partial [Opitutus sp.]
MEIRNCTRCRRSASEGQEGRSTLQVFFSEAQVLRVKMNAKSTFLAFLAALCALSATSALADGVGEPIPSFYQEPGPASKRATNRQHANERVDPFTGKLQWHFVDLYVPGNGGLDIKVQRSYSSLNEILGDDSPMGAGWTMHFGRVIRKSAVAICSTGQSTTNNAVLELPDGSRQILFDNPGGPGSLTTSLWKATCGQSGGLIVQSPDGVRYEMTMPGAPIGSGGNAQGTYYTSKIVDRNGNSLDFTYAYQSGTAFGVTGITSNDGRTVTFNYSNGVLSNVVGAGTTWTYSYSSIPGIGTSQYFLDHVTRPDGTAWNYEYNQTASGPGTGNAGGYSMKKVTYPTGGTIDYTYGFVTVASNPSLPVSTVITKKVTADGTWNYVYTPATVPMNFVNGTATYTIDPNASNNNAQFDKTVVSGPEGSTTYLHFGYTTVPSGAVYVIGALAGKISYSLIGGANYLSQIESNSWGMFAISSQPNVRPGAGLNADPNTQASVLVERSISRAGQIYKTTYSNFDSYMNPQTIVEDGSDVRTTTVTYYVDPAKWIIHQKQNETTDTIGTITRTFDPNGNILTETKYGVTTTFTYTGEGDIASKKDARGNTTVYSSYRRGIPQAENQPEGVLISRLVSDRGNITSQTDGESSVTTYGYDGLNRLTAIGHPAGNAVTVVWAPNTRTVTRGKYREVVTFDGYGRQLQVAHTDTASNATITQTYRNDSLGRRVFAS